ncbi:MAG: PAAR domain-containing protein [Myxococcales bacterium]|nr:PAAR domain-containing protein [Myxococcales bacterium]
MKVINAPMDAINMGIANATNGIAKVLPSFPAATMGALAIGLPHGHPHPPTFGVPLPPIGSVLFGCCVSVLIGGLPAARVGDIGLSPTCFGYTFGFEIFTGSSKVFIGGMRAARVLDVTMQCWQPKEWMARGAIAALVAAAKATQTAMMVAGVTAQVAGVAADASDAVGYSAEGDAAMAAASALAAGMGAAQLAADAVAMAAGAIIGKDPGVGPPVGALTIGVPNVLIGGFPMPSGMQLAGRKLAGAKRKKRARNDSEAGPGPCGGKGG